MERDGALPIERNFARMAELVAKTLYNCSGGSAPFDTTSFKKLIQTEQQLINDEDNYWIQDNMGLGRGVTPKNLVSGILQIVLRWFRYRQ